MGFVQNIIAWANDVQDFPTLPRVQTGTPSYQPYNTDNIWRSDGMAKGYNFGPLTVHNNGQPMANGNFPLTYASDPSSSNHGKATWHDAAAYCRVNGGVLFSVDSLDKHKALQAILTDINE